MKKNLENSPEGFHVPADILDQAINAYLKGDEQPALGPGAHLAITDHLPEGVMAIPLPIPEKFTDRLVGKKAFYVFE